jgi:hypothetical protein
VYSWIWPWSVLGCCWELGLCLPHWWAPAAIVAVLFVPTLCLLVMRMHSPAAHVMPAMQSVAGLSDNMSFS